MNSVMESLFYGVPLVVLPQIGEQFLTAQGVKESCWYLYFAIFLIFSAASYSLGLRPRQTLDDS